MPSRVNLENVHAEQSKLRIIRVLLMYKLRNDSQAVKKIQLPSQLLERNLGNDCECGAERNNSREMIKHRE